MEWTTLAVLLHRRRVSQVCLCVCVWGQQVEFHPCLWSDDLKGDGWMDALVLASFFLTLPPVVKKRTSKVGVIWRGFCLLSSFFYIKHTLSDESRLNPCGFDASVWLHGSRTSRLRWRRNARSVIHVGSGVCTGSSTSIDGTWGRCSWWTDGGWLSRGEFFVCLRRVREEFFMMFGVMSEL